MISDITPGRWIVEAWSANEGQVVALNQGSRSLICAGVMKADARLIAAAPGLAKAAAEAKILIGARNDNLSEAARQSNINAACHLLDNALAKIVEAAA